jgi:hypothetical protein
MHLTLGGWAKMGKQKRKTQSQSPWAKQFEIARNANAYTNQTHWRFQRHSALEVVSVSSCFAPTKKKQNIVERTCTEWPSAAPSSPD